MERGVTQGDMDSPIIFNLIIDAVLQCLQGEKDFKGTIANLYADNGILQHTNLISLQRDLDQIVQLIEIFGLRANRTKTIFFDFERTSSTDVANRLRL